MAGNMLDMLKFALKPQIRERHIQKTPATPLKRTYETNEKAARRHPDSQEFVINEIIEHNEDVKTFVLNKKDGSKPAYFRAGQYVVIRQVIDGKLIARPVSISCGPGRVEDGEYTLTVKRVPATGFMSQYILENWRVGDTVTTSGPQGTFYYSLMRDAENVVAVAGGSGITPVLSMAQAIADGDEDFNLVVLYGSRSTKDMLFADEFAEVMKKTDKVKVINVLSEEQADGCESGFITAELIKKYAADFDGNYSVFAAGPQAMYRFLDAEVEKLGLEQKYYRKELFGSVRDPWNLPGYPQEAKDKTFNMHVIMCDQEYDIPVAANENMIVALERAGIAGPNRCRGGICGWCRSKLVSGTVFIPEETDGRRAADKLNGYIHPCASFATSDITIEVPLNK